MTPAARPGAILRTPFEGRPLLRDETPTRRAVRSWPRPSSWRAVGEGRCRVVTKRVTLSALPGSGWLPRTQAPAFPGKKCRSTDVQNSFHFMLDFPF